MPAPRGRHLVTLACCAIAAALPAASRADPPVLNVSKLVLGTEEPLPPEGWAVISPCGNDCRYATVSGTQMSNGYGSWPGALNTAAWPVFYSNVEPLYEAVQDNLAVAAAPAGTAYSSLPSGVKQRSRVAYSYLWSEPASSRQLDVQTFKSGRGASAVSYAVRINTPPAGARRTFLRFKLPTLVRDGQYATEVAGPSGNQPLSTMPKRLQARSAVDVYVDGLPVWSSQSMRLLPQRYNPSLPGTLELQWGGALDGSNATLFLGTLPAGSARSAVIVLRSDLRVDAPTCHTVNQPLGLDERSCDAQLEGLSLPTQASAPFYIHNPDISVYTR